MASEPQRAGGWRGRQWALAWAAVAGLVPILGGPVHAQQKPFSQDAPPEPGKRPVAYIYGTIPITRDDLGEYLIARGGMDKIDLLVNKFIIEYEAGRRRGETVTSTEVLAGLQEDIAESGLTQDQFVQKLLPRYGKSLYEWEEDVVRLRLLLAKLARDRVRVTEDDLKRAFESQYGERREAIVIVWPKGPNELTPAQKADALNKPEEFDKLAKTQPNELAGSGGKAKPVGRYTGLEPAIEAALFSFKEGEAQWIESQTTSTCVKCNKVIPPDAMVTFERVRAVLEKEVRDKKLSVAIGEIIRELRAAANPTLTTQVPVPKTTDPNTPPPVRVAHQDPRVLALIYKDFPVTRSDLGEFLIARGGFEKLELLVNRRIIDRAAALRGITISPGEVEASLIESLRTMGLSREAPGVSPEEAIKMMKEDFATRVLTKTGKTMYEYIEDVIVPELILKKMCHDKVKVTDAEIQKAFASQYGEKRTIKMIIWAKEEFRIAQRQWEEARKGDAEFDRVAKGQRDGRLASSAGQVAPIGRGVDADSPQLEQILFGYLNAAGETVQGLQVGEMSHLFETPVGIICVKCTGIVPPAQGVALAQVRPVLEKQVYERKLAREIPQFFAQLRQEANPNLLLKGPPTPEENAAGVRVLIERVSASTPAEKK